MRRSFTSRAVRGTALAAALAVATLAPQGARAENLADALVGAYNTSGLLEQNRALLRAADEDVAIAVSALRPVIDWTASVSRNLVESGTGPVVTNRRTSEIFVGLTAELLIFDSGGRQYAIKAAKESVLATRQSLVSVEQSILLRAVAAYFNVVLQQQNVSLRENNVRLLGEELRAAEDRFEVGEVTRTDVALAQSRLAAARSNLAAARGQSDSAQAEYLAAVGQRPKNLVRQPRLPDPPATVDAAIAVAMRNHPDILSVQRQVAAAEFNILRAQSAMGPSVSLRGNVGATEDFSDSDYGRNTSISLNMRQPIYQGGRLTAQVRRAMATRDATRASLLSTQENVAQSAANAYIRLDVARSSLRASDERIRAAEVAFEGIREEAKLGARTTLDVLQAEQELLDARTARISALAEESIAAFQLVAAQGLLTAERLKLGVQIYDPNTYYNMVKSSPGAFSKQSRDLDRVLQSLGKK